MEIRESINTNNQTIKQSNNQTINQTIKQRLPKYSFVGFIQEFINNHRWLCFYGKSGVYQPNNQSNKQPNNQRLPKYSFMGIHPRNHKQSSMVLV